MDLTPYVENLRNELAVAAEAGGDDARALAERLTAPLESAVRLTLLDALSAAADEITRDLAPGSVEVRLRGGEPEFVVAPAPADEPDEPAPDAARAAPAARRRGGRHGADQPPPPRAAQGRRRGGRRPRAAVGQRLARPRGAAAAATDDRPAAPPRGGPAASLHRLGPLTPARPYTDTRPDLTTETPHAYFPHPRTDLRHDRVVVGDVRITASDRTDTVVEVRPSDPSNAADVKAAEQTRVEYTDGQLLVKAPKLRPWLPRRGGGSVDVTIELPAGSASSGTGQLGGLPLRGPARRLPAQDRGSGRSSVDQRGTLGLKTGSATSPSSARRATPR